MSTESVMPSSHLILCHPLLLPPSIFPSIRVFSSESALRIRWPKYWSFSFSISPSNEYSGLISFRTDWLDLPAVQGTLKSLLQHHSSKAPILWCLAFACSVQLSHWCKTNGKTTALTRQTLNLQVRTSPKRTCASSQAPRSRVCVSPGPGSQRRCPKDALQEEPAPRASALLGAPGRVSRNLSGGSSHLYPPWTRHSQARGPQPGSLQSRGDTSLVPSPGGAVCKAGSGFPRPTDADFRFRVHSEPCYHSMFIR